AAAASQHRKDNVDTYHLDLHPDLTNGLLLDLMKNTPPHAPETKVSYVAATPKPRLVKLLIKPEGEETFWAAGVRHSATRFTLKVELGGVAGIVAPVLGKQPNDTHVWIIAV